MFDVVQTALADWKQQTDDQIRRLQRENGLLLQSIAAQSLPLAAQTPGTSSPPPRPIPQITKRSPGELVVSAAEAEWRRGVREPVTPGDNYATIIDGYIRGPHGLGWNTTDVRTWKSGVPYMKNLDFQWCGAFAAYCWSAVGLKASLRRDHLAGTDRLWSWARGTQRLIENWRTLQPGDIMVVGHGSKIPGGHITLVRETPSRIGPILTYEGNAMGEGINGARYEGVVKNARLIDPAPHAQTFCFGVRPLAELGDFE